MEKDTPYIQTLRWSSQPQSSSRRSSGWRITNASTRSACSPTIRLQIVLSLCRPGRVTAYDVSPVDSHSSSRSAQTASISAATSLLRLIAPTLRPPTGGRRATGTPRQ